MLMLFDAGLRICCDCDGLVVATIVVVVVIIVVVLVGGTSTCCFSLYLCNIRAVFIKVCLSISAIIFFAIKIYSKDELFIYL